MVAIGKLVEQPKHAMHLDLLLQCEFPQLAAVTLDDGTSIFKRVGASLSCQIASKSDPFSRPITTPLWAAILA